MGKSLFFCCAAFSDIAGGSVNVSDRNRTEAYIKSAFVALRTIQLQNPGSDIDVALIHNRALPDTYRDLFVKHGILLLLKDFDSFTVPSTNKWFLAFYKLTTLEYALTLSGYDTVVQIDCDVVCNGSLSDMLTDLQDKVLMLSGPFTYSHPIRQLYRECYETLYHQKNDLFKWGSGLIGGPVSLLVPFIEQCRYVWENMVAHYCPAFDGLGDEFLTSVAALNNPNIHDGKMYMDVYWTRKFYLVSTNYMLDKMVLLHCPDEKSGGILTLYRHLVKYNAMPSEKKLRQILFLPNLSLARTESRIIGRICQYRARYFG